VPSRDEGTWDPPASWWEGVLPWRGAVPAVEIAVDEDKVVLFRDLFARFGSRVAAALDEPGSDPDLVARATLHLGRTGDRFRPASPEPNPLGAAVVAAVLGMAAQQQDRERATGAVDAWVAEHGVTFAAEAGALLARVHAHDVGYWTTGWPGRVFPVRPPGPGTSNSGFDPYPLLVRLRTFLAAAGDAAYAEATGRLGPLRALGPEVRAATSFLLPTRRDWVEADIAESLTQAAPDVSALLFASVATARQFRDLLPLLGRTKLGCLNSAVAVTGPACAPVLDLLYDRFTTEGRKSIVDTLARFPTDEAFAVLLTRLAEPHTQPAVLAASRRFPRRAMRLLAAAAAGDGGHAAIARDLLGGSVLSNPGLAGEIEVPAASAEALRTILAEVAAVPVAAPDQVPALLARPPWTGRGRARKPAVVAGLAVPSDTAVPWRPGEREAFAGSGHRTSEETPEQWQEWVPLARRGSMCSASLLARGPEDLVRPLLGSANHQWWFQPEQIKPVLARFSEDAVDYVARAVDTRPSALAQALAPVAAPRIAGRMAMWAVRNKTLRPTAHTWFLRHPDAAARGLVPAALGKPGTERAYAEAALRFLAQNGCADAVSAAAQAAAPAAQAAVAEVLTVDPLRILPAKMPALPDWLDVAYLPPVQGLGPGGARPVRRRHDRPPAGTAGPRLAAQRRARAGRGGRRRPRSDRHRSRPRAPARALAAGRLQGAAHQGGSADRGTGGRPGSDAGVMASHSQAR
jgi:hypothetical protein